MPTIYINYLIYLHWPLSATKARRGRRGSTQNQGAVADGRKLAIWGCAVKIKIARGNSCPATRFCFSCINQYFSIASIEYESAALQLHVGTKITPRRGALAELEVPTKIMGTRRLPTLQGLITKYFEDDWIRG